LPTPRKEKSPPCSEMPVNSPEAESITRMRSPTSGEVQVGSALPEPASPPPAPPASGKASTSW
jgi:hypothetical protein